MNNIYQIFNITSVKAMKTIKILLSVAGFAITSLCFGQLFSENNKDVLFYTAYYNQSADRLEHHINPFPPRITAGDYYNAPLFSRTYFVPVDYDIPVESWMTEPFENTYSEEEMQVELWMESPFDWGYDEEELEVESWMTRPFGLNAQTEVEIDEEIEIEDWMTTPWI